MSQRDDDGSGGDEGFLTRWSRRKREVIEQEVPSPAPAQIGPSLADALPVQAEPDSSEPDMVEPPSLDLVDKDFDVAHWLKQNVPESWKLAALRRAWESDPAIRDFENPARDYALDWNTPGGAPGYGPLTESDDVESMVRGIFGEPPPELPPDQIAEPVGDSMSHPLSSKDETRTTNVAEQQEGVPVIDAEIARDVQEAVGEANLELTAPRSVERAFVAAQHSGESEPVGLRLRRRNGGAIPL